MKSIATVFSESLGIDQSRVVDQLAYNEIKEWDSVAHMALIAALEGEYGIMIETDEVLGMSSVAKTKEILARHGIHP